MPTYKIRGIGVDFPYEAYDCQLVYMEKVIQSLQQNCNALLESPTGTGKTLCLLCATLAWRKSLGNFSSGGSVRSSQNDKGNQNVSPSQSKSSKHPTILYTTRTHSQLRQVIQELKKTTYRPKMVVLGSREQLCIHDEVSLLHGKTQNNACRSLCRKRGKRHCNHYIRVPDYMKNNPHLGEEPLDIEDLVNIGKSFGPCPYYVSRELHKAVDIMFAPYNYLIDGSYRKSLALEWKDSILIFDEAHNLESICADAASFDLSSWLLTACITEAKYCIDLSIKRREESNDKSGNPDNFAILRALLLKLEKRISEVPIQSKELGFTKPGPFIYELLAELNVTHATVSKLKAIVEEAATLLEEDKQQKMQSTGCRLQTFSEILDIIFREKGNVHANFYRVHVQENEGSATSGLKGKASRTLSWWCFNPGIALEAFPKMEVGSIILTSGTLSPLDSFAQELKLDFPIRLENPHVICSNQIWVGVVPVGPSGCSFNSSYRNRESEAYKLDLGNAIVNFTRIVPDGLLVFFPSYYFLDQCIECWKSQSPSSTTTIWERICKLKRPVIEPRQSSLFPSSIEDYMSKLKDTSASGAVFFAVCRGKVSEGLDFADHAGRAVIITGMPYPSRNDPKVRLKREYLDYQSLTPREGQVLMGEDWYNQQASRAVNQAVGRVIRHRHDYGAIIFCDERFAHSSRQSQISSWIQPHIKSYSKFGDVVYTLTRFFRDDKNQICPKLPTVKTEDRNVKSEHEEADTTKLADISCAKSSTSIDAGKKMFTGDVQENTTAKSFGKFYVDKFIGQMPTFQDCPVKSLSSLLNVKAANQSSYWGEVLPANSPSVTSFNYLSSTIKNSNNQSCSGKKLVSSDKKPCPQNDEIIDLTASMDEQPNKAVMVGSAAKKRKLFRAEHAPPENLGNSFGSSSGAKPSESNSPSLEICSVNPEPSPSDSRDMQNGLVDSALLCGTKSDDQKDKTINCIPAPLGDKEARGYDFLSQARKKLSAREYEEFIGFMKALKTKAMTFGQVLQSIVRIFSGPERLHLRKGFKDYLPAKYQSFYEDFLETSK